jgi:hypothetical protein
VEFRPLWGENVIERERKQGLRSGHPMRETEGIAPPGIGPERKGGMEENRVPRRPYVAPRLEDLGDVRDVTLGVSGGIGDSAGGGPATQHPF